MRTLRVFEHISLDGVIQLPGNTVESFALGDWTAPYRSPAGLAKMVELHGQGYDLLLGPFTPGREQDNVWVFDRTPSRRALGTD